MMRGVGGGGGDPSGLTLGRAPIGPRRSMYAKKQRNKQICASAKALKIFHNYQ